LNKKLSKKDLKVWKDFIDSEEKILNKDNIREEIFSKKQEATIDLHGFPLDKANIKVENFITNCYEKKIGKIKIITGKGLRSKVDQNPYQSKDLGILKYSVPEFIKLNYELMKIIKKIEDNVDNKNIGYFYLYLKLKDKFR
tara:strand:+ start:559 stop:981 length:423 start_codon:yes stop_codon:yes gene_type:complete